MQDFTVNGSKIVTVISALVVVGGLYGGAAKLRLKPVSTARQNGGPKAEVQAPTSENAYFDSSGNEWSPAQRAEAVAAMVTWWDAHKKHFKHVVKEELPAAVAHRNAVIPPDLDAIMAFPQSYLPGSSVHDPEARKHKDAQQELCWQHINDFGRDQGELNLLNAYGRAMSDLTPVGQHLTVRELALLELSNEPGVHWFRSNTADVERTMFGDEDAAQRVETIQTGDEFAAYLQAAQPRFQAKVLRIDEHAGFDARSIDYLLDERRMDVANRVTQFYKWDLSREVNVIHEDLNAVASHINAELVAASSRDDAASRRLLTELKETFDLQQAADLPPTKPITQIAP